MEIAVTSGHDHLCVGTKIIIIHLHACKKVAKHVLWLLFCVHVNFFLHAFVTTCHFVILVALICMMWEGVVSELMFDAFVAEQTDEMIACCSNQIIKSLIL